MNAVGSREADKEYGDDDDQREWMEEKAEELRRFTLGALCFASVSILTAVLLIPLIVSSARGVQSGVDQQASRCLGKLARVYNQMDRMAGNVAKGRVARHVPTTTRNKLQQAIKSQRKARYLQQKLAETAALLNSREVWEDSGGAGRNKVEEGEAAKKSKDDAKSAERARDKGAEIVAEESTAAMPEPGGRQKTELFGSSSSFEISSEQHWHNQQQQKGGGGAIFDFTTSFPLPPIPRVSPRVHSSKEVKLDTSSPAAAPPLVSAGFTVAPASREQPVQALQPRQATNDATADDQCCACAAIHGPPGPPGFAGTDGQPGRDGRPGQNGLNGRDAPQDHQPNAEDFCFNCPRGPPGEVGPKGPKGAPGEAGLPGKDGEDGRKGVLGRRGPAGQPGPSGKAGLSGKGGQPGRVVDVPGPEGIEGSAGKPGLPGPPGTPGEPGYAERGRPGPVGDPGLDGKNGAVGVAGKPGAPGKPGPPGGCAHCNAPRTAPGY